MRLAFFIQDLRGGGAERTTVRIVNGVAERGIPVALVVLKRQGPFFAELDPRVRVVDLAIDRMALAPFALARYLRRERPDIVFSTMTHANVAAVLANYLSGLAARLVVVEHNQFDRNFARKRGLVRLAYRLVPLTYLGADRIAAVSVGVAESISRTIRIPLESVRVLYNPVVTRDVAMLAGAPVDHRFFEGDEPVIVAVGRLTRQKNYPLLLEAFAKLVATVPARLIILGEGELRDELEQKVAALGLEERVSLPGFNANPFPYFARAAAFVMSSDWEGLPTVMIEALSCGTPVVSTDCVSGPSEILEAGRYGRLTPPGDADELAAALAEAIRHPADPAPRIARAQAFSVERAVDGYIDEAAALTRSGPSAATVPRQADT